jgi:hypothetical protein
MSDMGETHSELSKEAFSWAKQELEGRVLQIWQQYKTGLELEVPESFVELVQNNPSFSTTIERLHQVKMTLQKSGEMTPEDLKLDETMHLVLMPWQAFRNHSHHLPDLMSDLRTSQGKPIGYDLLYDEILSALEYNSYIYRGIGDSLSELPVEEYLDLKLNNDGPWGVGLVQTSNQAGLARLIEGPSDQRSPNALTQNGTAHFRVAEQNVDALGLFEWLALTLQENPENLSIDDSSWLLANRLDAFGQGMCVPSASWISGTLCVGIDKADFDSTLIRPRLAIL